MSRDYRFDSLAQAVKRLPLRTERALNSTVALSDVANSLVGLPLITSIQQLAARAQSLMEDIHSEASDLFSVSSSMYLCVCV